MQYRIVNPVKSNGGTHQPGELVDFTQKEADELLKTGAIEAVHVPFARGNLSMNINLGDHNV